MLAVWGTPSIYFTVYISFNIFLYRVIVFQDQNYDGKYSSVINIRNWPNDQREANGLSICKPIMPWAARFLSIQIGTRINDCTFYLDQEC